MSLNLVTPGDNAPEEFNVIIEIPMNSDPVKYEVDEDTGAVFVDRFMLAAMHYPVNYGYVPQSVSEDGDAADVLVLSPFPIQIGAVVKCRAIGVLEMEDEAGGDSKVLAVPVTKLYPPYRHIQGPEDLPQEELDRLKHFFERYKDLEKGKWVKVKDWHDAEAAKKEIRTSIERFNANK
ncbi:MAG TPA: inorganic diphosphatase [Candidatus Paenalcaligenes intestinipullorum]|uniref:Inorganic pyrophosphatase n=1 Tax=Candidatus Paenalcaligenes intestinipullorum TaxID=2838718 RepID=A0A9D2U9S6_9BURK|nr:inorganic diphosphatase [Candidatus Paenalcaligenes intestinipullorum]